MHIIWEYETIRCNCHLEWWQLHNINIISCFTKEISIKDEGSFPILETDDTIIFVKIKRRRKFWNHEYLWMCMGLFYMCVCYICFMNSFNVIYFSVYYFMHLQFCDFYYIQRWCYRSTLQLFVSETMDFLF